MPLQGAAGDPASYKVALSLTVCPSSSLPPPLSTPAMSPQQSFPLLSAPLTAFTAASWARLRKYIDTSRNASPCQKGHQWLHHAGTRARTHHAYKSIYRVHNRAHVEPFQNVSSMRQYLALKKARGVRDLKR
eukprot:scaffold84693_cov37-Tisochrysis_lutea.AAC.1